MLLTDIQQRQTLTDSQRDKLQLDLVKWKYYENNTRNWLMPKTLPNGHLIDDNVKIALSRKIVNKGVTFLFGKPLTWQVTKDGSKDTATSEPTTEETVLSQIWGNQETQTAFLAENAINGGVVGSFHFQIVAKEGQPLKVKYLDPTWVFVEHDPEDINAAFNYMLPYKVGDDLYRLRHEKTNLNWIYLTERWNVNKWVIETPPVTWPYEWPFIISGKNLPKPNSFYGASDLEDADINDAINLVASNVNRIVRIYANPIVWGYGFGSNAMNIDSSKVITATDSEASLNALELARDLNSPQEHLKFLRSMYSEVTNVPESDPERLKIGASSGFALEVLFNDLLLKTGVKRAFYGKALIELNRRLLELSGFGDNNQTLLHWPNPLPVDKVSETTSDQFDLNAGLSSKRTMATKRGYDYDQETEYQSHEQTNNTALGENILAAFRNGQG